MNGRLVYARGNFRPLLEAPVVIFNPDPLPVGNAIFLSRLGIDKHERIGVQFTHGL